MKAVIYARVSTGDQDTERQVKELTQLAKLEGYNAVNFFNDVITGSSKQISRNGFIEMLAFIQENNINQVYCWELSRLGRTMIENYKIIQDFREKQINICIKKEGINTRNNDANTQLQLNILSSIAEYELSTIKTRTISGMYNSIKNGGVGSGVIKQYGYKKLNGKLVIDEDEKAVILDVVDKYLNQDYSILQITNYLNESGVETRYRKLVDSKILDFKLPSQLLWTTSTVNRLLHKKHLIGFRKYGKVELQDENFRIISDATFEALQVKMASKRDTEPNAQKFENILKGLLVCGNCGGAMVMHKGSDGRQHHYKCFNRFYLKSDCTAKMIDIDLLNNTVYKQSKDYKVDSVEVAAKIEKLNTQLRLNTTAINQAKAELSNISSREERLVALYINGQVNLSIYEKQLKTITEEAATSTEKIAKLESTNFKLQNEVSEINSKKSVNLSNPETFKSNIKNLVAEIQVTTLDDEALEDMNTIIENQNGEKDAIKRKHKRDVIYTVRNVMFDEETVFIDVVSNVCNTYPRVIKVGKI